MHLRIECQTRKILYFQVCTLKLEWLGAPMRQPKPGSPRKLAHLSSNRRHLLSKTAKNQGRSLLSR